MEAERRQVALAVAEAKIRYHADALVGMTVADAREVVEAAGGEFVTDDQPIRAKWDPHRVIASVTADRVTRVDIA